METAYRSDMPTLTIDLPAQGNQTAFNIRCWSRLRSDPHIRSDLAKVRGRIETDRHGHIIMLPPPGPSHGSYQSEIAYLLRTLLPDGRVITECPVSTADGVKGADVAWASQSRFATTHRQSLLTGAPEICVEVLSPDNSRAEMAEKRALYFAAGAREVWMCDREGRMTFFTSANSRGQKSSKFCPDFPREIRF